jgi:hypothetical protein
MRTNVTALVTETSLCSCNLKVALVHVLKELRGADDQIDQRTKEGDEGDNRRENDEEPVSDSAPCVRPCPVDQRKPDDYDSDDQKVEKDVHRVLFRGESVGRTDPTGRWPV